MDRSTAKRIIKSKPAFTPLILNKALLAFISFFMGRVVIFQSLNPIVPAFMGCMCFSGANFYISVLFSFIGLLTKSDINCFIKYMIFMAVMLIINIAVPTSKREKGLTFKSAASAIIILISALIFAAINSFSLYYTILAVLESILTFSIAMVLDKGVNIISKKNLLIASMPDREDIISISLIAGSVIAGASDLSLSGISVSIMLCSAISIIITYVYGGSAGAAASAMITLIMAVSSYCPFELMCIFSCAAIFSSVNKNLKKIFFAAVYSFICLILTIYLKKSLLISENIYAFLTAVLIFMLVPVKKLENMTKAPTNADEYISELKAVTINRLDNFSSSFAKLSKTLSDLSKKRTIAEKKEVSSIIDDVAAQLCIKCSMKNFCWENNFYSTYQTIFSILSVCEQKGFANEDDIGDSFINSCIQKDKFISTINRMYEIHKTNMAWQNKLNESRELVSQQLNGVSSIINQLSDELSLGLSYKSRLSERVRIALEEKGIYAKNVIVSENKFNQNEIIIKHSPCYGCKKCEKTIIPILNSVLKKRFCKEYSQCITSKENRQYICTLRLEEEKRFGITPAVAGIKKDGSPKSGDCTAFIPLPDGRYLLALSDAMGSGIQAQKESAAALELFEDFIGAGFSKQTTVNMINSVLILKSSRESFSTLDVCTIDLRKGEAEFIKIGAATSFIKRNAVTEIIKSSSLPVGILAAVEPETSIKKLSDSDIIVMVSDGVLDSSPNTENKESFIISILENTSSSSAGEIANEILKIASENSNGKINDDMTVLAAKIFERKA